MKNILEAKIIVYGVLAIILLALLNSISKRFSLSNLISPENQKKKAEEKEEAQKFILSDFFNPATYKTAGSFQQIDAGTLEKMSEQIRDAIKGPYSLYGFSLGWGTDEAAIYDVFKQLYNKLNASQLADAYNLKYGRSLRADLINDLDNSEMAFIQGIIEKLPLR